MFDFFRKKHNNEVVSSIMKYISETYVDEAAPTGSRKPERQLREIYAELVKGKSFPTYKSPEVTPSKNSTQKNQHQESGILYSFRELSPLQKARLAYSEKYLGGTDSKDKYTRASVDAVMRDILNDRAEGCGLALKTNQSFSEKLIDLITENGQKDSSIYKAANMDRRLYSKIVSDKDYKPSKDTVLAFVFALRLSMPQASDLLYRAGYVLSHSNRRDIAIEYFIQKGIYDINNVNFLLDKLGQKVIGRA